MRPFFISKFTSQKTFRLLNISVILLLLSFQKISVANEKTNTSTPHQKKIIFLGDSLTEGLGVEKNKAYPALIQEKIINEKLNYQVINSGVSGSTTASALNRVKWLMSSKPDVIVLALGANDGLRGLPVNESEKNLQAAIDLITNNKIKIILLGVLMPPNYGKKYTDDFKKMYLHLARKNKINLIPFILDEVAGNPKLNQADGIHPNEKGHQVIADKLFPQLKGLL